MAGLVEHALSIVPESEVENTPIFLLATAGMRLLPDYQRNAVLKNVCSYLQSNTKFQLPDCDLHIQVIPGETEGLYGWIAANYLLGGFDRPEQHDHGKNHNTYGFLDMGGASAQIAFAPNATEAEKHANDLTLLRLRTIDGAALEYRVFTTTWLGFGANEARRRYVTALMDASPGSLELPDPCLPSGLTVTKSGDVIMPGSREDKGHEAYLLGTGAFDECLKRTFPLLEKDAFCADPPCLVHGVHVPAIDFDVNHFVGVSEYWHTTRRVFEKGHKDVAYDFNTYQEQVSKFCSQNWSDIQHGVEDQKWGKGTDEATAAEVCFKASWLINMLHDGIGIPRVGLEAPVDGYYKNGTKAILDGAKEKGFLDPFQAIDEIDNTEVSWTIGKMILYAASQVPPKDEAMAVGFGTNTPGVTTPKDFQFAGGKSVVLPNDLTDEDADWHDKLFASASQRRVPGLLLFSLIVVVVLFLLCGRERRMNMLNRVLGLFGRDPIRSSRGGKRNKGLFGFKTGPSYERVLEDGAQDELELGEFADDSDSDNDISLANSLSQKTRASGTTTPKLGSQSPTLHSSPRSKINPDSSTGPPAVTAVDRLGMGSRTESRERLTSAITAMDRLGMGSRTESRERLTLPGMASTNSGSRSRQTSPTRRSPLVTPFKENLD